MYLSLVSIIYFDVGFTFSINNELSSAGNISIFPDFKISLIAWVLVYISALFSEEFSGSFIAVVGIFIWFEAILTVAFVFEFPWAIFFEFISWWVIGLFLLILPCASSILLSPSVIVGSITWLSTIFPVIFTSFPSMILGSAVT